MMGGTAADREDGPATSPLYPWYDSQWLTAFERATAIVRAVRPDALAAFVDAFAPLRTRPDFQVKLLEAPFDRETLREIRHAVASLRPADLELHEASGFGRFVVHNHPVFTRIQERAVPLVSEAVGEPVEASAYNFLSLYTRLGVCPLHLDAPDVKWTLDLCIDQSTPWPLYVSRVRPWPEPDDEAWREKGWQDALKRSPSVRFTAYTLRPGQAVVFSGSAQWHYRDRLPGEGTRHFCTLLFLHFTPRGTAELVQPKHWARLFGIPELSQVARRTKAVAGTVGDRLETYST